MDSRITVSSELKNQKLLSEEARYLHKLMFQRDATDNLVNTYVRIHCELPDFQLLDEQGLTTVNLIVLHRLDAISIEPWLRRRKIRHPLTAKLLLLAYLSECDARHPEFSRHLPIRGIALINIGLSAAKGGFQLLNGLMQKIRYGLL